MKNPLPAAAAAGILLACALCFGVDMDPARYLSIDQIQPGMEGWNDGEQTMQSSRFGFGFCCRLASVSRTP